MSSLPVRHPLQGLVILDALSSKLAPATRYLAELGAHVLRLELDAPGPLDSREAVRAFAANTGKSFTAGDPASPGLRSSLMEAIIRADAVLFDPHGPFGQLMAELASESAKVIVAASDFGTGNDFAEWQATDPVLHAMTGELSRSGISGRPPLLPPGELATQCAAVHLAYVTLVGFLRYFQTGTREAIDFSALDGAMQALDPGYGINGSATVGVSPRTLSPGRPKKGFQYPILPCADGHVRICLLAPRQWRGMFEWMGRPEEFASSEFEKLQVRYASPTLLPAMASFFADKRREDLESGAVRHGVPLSAVLTTEEALEAPHFAERKALVEVAGPGGEHVRLPNGVLSIDDSRMTAKSIAAEGIASVSFPARSADGLPLAGLKVLDLGVIVVGAEQSRLLADLGADVIKIESRAFPDGTRQSMLRIGLSFSFASGHRNKRSLGLNLRSEKGLAIFRKLAAQADVVLTNFKPGTLESLGIGYEDLKAINPSIILVESSAFGSTGPWAKRMGYGPLVRAATGLTKEWCYPGDPDGHSDSVTIYPDHVGGRVSVLGVLALLLDRARSGRGGKVASSQAEIVLAHKGWQIAARGLPEIDLDEPEDAPWGVYPCAGEDQWCVVTMRGDSDWRALAQVIDGLDPSLSRKQRLEARGSIEEAVSAWTCTRSTDQVASTLQAAGVPAAAMLQITELPNHAYYRQRGFFRTESHPWLDETFQTEAMHARFSSLPVPPQRPAPLAGENTADVMRDWLGMSDEAIGELVASGVLEPMSDKLQALLDGIERDRANAAVETANGESVQ